MTKAKDMTNGELAWQLDRDNESGDWGGPHDELTEAAARLRAMDWQPIESAPRDGTWFWAEDRGDAICVRWHEEFQAFVSTWREMTYVGGDIHLHSPTSHYPKYWMRSVPLPPPPKEGEE